MMPVPRNEDLGPLAALVGTWEGSDGLDVAFSNEKGMISETPFFQRTTFSPFGPVDNGRQHLFGLDYRTSAFRMGEDEPFHTEVGYWLWDAAAGQVFAAFNVPRGQSVLAGGPATATSSSFVLTAELGSTTYGILSNQFLDQFAKTTKFEVTITVNADGSFSYDETTTIDHKRSATPILHTDRNTLRKVG
jgi:hypothetical protein